MRRLLETVREDVRLRPRTFTAAAVSGLLLAVPTLVAWSWPLAFVALVPYLTTIRPCLRDGRARTSVLVTLVMAAVWYAVSVYWLFSLVTFHWTAVPAAVLIIALGLSQIVVLPLCLRIVHRHLGVASALVLPFVWITMERLRWPGDLYFPWLDLGYDLAPAPFLVQFADIVGVAGVGFWIVVVNLCFSELYTQRPDPRKRRVAAAVLAAALALPLSYDFFAWQRHAPTDAGSDRIKVALVQPNIPQSLKWEPQGRTHAIVTVHAAAGVAAAFRPQLMVLPESVLPFLLRTDGDPSTAVEMASVEAMIGNYGMPLLAGAITVAGKWPDQTYANSAVLYDAIGNQVGRYDKTRLVPVVEALPFPRLLGWIARIAGTDILTRGLSASIALGLANMRPGPEPTVLRADGLPPLGVLICFESVFPGIAREERRKGARLLVSVSNDAWFGETAAGYQHAAFLVLRAVENRSWIVRAANTGISAVYDPRGTVVARTRLSTPALLTAEVPPAGAPPPFTRTRWDPMVTLCLAVTGGLVSAAWVAGRRHSSTGDRSARASNAL